MKYSVLIRQNATGIERLRHMDDIEWDDSSEYWWTEGNMGCVTAIAITNGCAPEVPGL